MRNFGLTSGTSGSDLRGQQRPIRPSYAQNSTQRNFKTFSSAALPPLPSGSIAGSPSFKRSKFMQASIDVGFVAFVVLFICAAAASIGAGIFFLLFCRF